MDETKTSKFNRSFTRSEPNLYQPKANLNCRQVNITEYFHQGGTNQSLIRQYSYRELHGNPGEYAHYRDEYLTSAITGFNNIQFEDNFIFKQPKNPQSHSIQSDDDLEFEVDGHFEGNIKERSSSPMDIDQSQDTIDTTSKEDIWSGKKLNIISAEKVEEFTKENQAVDFKAMANVDKKQTSTSKVSLIHIVLCLCLPMIAAFLFFYNSVTLKDISINDIEKDLKSQIFNQNHIVDTLIHNLNKIHTSTDFKKVLILVGSTGVGKTHVLNRIQSKYPSNLFISLNYDLDKDIINGEKNISLPKQCFILSLDNLNMGHVPVVSNYIKSIYHDCVLVIAVFNIQETSDNLNHTVRYDYFKQIAQYYSDQFINSEALLFNVMFRKHLEAWVKIVIEQRGGNINEHSDFIKMLLESHDVESYGFKGVIPKINLFS